MNELISLHENKGNTVVDAREVHEFLESKQDFSDWIKNRIKKYVFIENQDYTTFHKVMERGGNRSGGAKRKEYALKLNMAQKLCMVENTTKGDQARDYFIAVENRYRNLLHPDITDKRELYIQLSEAR